MIEFFMNYPLGYYLKKVIEPTGQKRVGIFLSRDNTMLMVKGKGGPEFWSGNLAEMNGAPRLEITEGTETANLPTSYKREIIRKLGLGKGNPLTLIVDDPESYTATYIVNNFENAGDLEIALRANPGNLISSWKNYDNEKEYNWEILSTSMEILRGKSKLPKKVVLCGFPEERLIATCKWADSSDQELINFVPTTAAILKWAVKYGTDPQFFVLIALTNEIGICYIDKGEIKIYAGQKTKDGFAVEDISDLNDLADENGQGKNSAIWTYGILPGSNIHERLIARYKNLKTLIPEQLRKIRGIEIKNNKEEINEKEAWLLENEIQ